MALTLQEIRDYVYLHLELDEDDVPVNLIDTWATEGFLRVVKSIRKWPFYRSQANFTTVSGQQQYSRTDDLGGLRTIASIQGPWGEMRYGEHQEMSQRYFRTGATTTTSGRPESFSEWGDIFYLWPVPNDSYDIRVLGYREAVVFGSDPASSPDMPDQFHQLIRSWVLYRAYLHQDDTELAEIEIQQFQGMLDLMIAEEIRDDGIRPMVYGGTQRNNGNMPWWERADYSTWV